MAGNHISRRQIHVRGIVQGVGFRPFVYNLAQRLRLAGYVLNSSAGVLIEVEGSAAELDDFVRALNEDAPPLANIEDLDVAALEPAGYSSFVIRESVDEPGKLVPVSPDVGTCDDCMRDFRTPANRRYGYPFTNCTNCGPRYTITRKIPYDRPLTTMACFAMCPECLREYEDPANRRFHAQPNACPNCGPSLVLDAGEFERGRQQPAGNRRSSTAAARGPDSGDQRTGWLSSRVRSGDRRRRALAARTQEAQRQTVRADGS